MNLRGRAFRAVAMGASVGGLSAMSEVLSKLRPDFSLPILLVQHLSPDSDSAYVEQVAKQTSLLVKEAEEKEHVQPGVVYTAPPNYHLMVEPDASLALSVEDRVSYSRPSIDVLFESAAWVYGPALAAVLLTGGNHDGAQGLALVRERGGLAVVQDPGEAQCAIMPQAALDQAGADAVLGLSAIAELLNSLQDAHEGAGA
ncbi:MAG: chemotaxis protein CheB [Desulfovibrionaceae bacterium]